MDRGKSKNDKSKNDKPKTVEKWYRVHEVMGLTGFGRSFLYEQMGAGNLRSVKCGGARRIPESALVEFQARYNGSGEVTND